MLCPGVEDLLRAGILMGPYRSPTCTYRERSLPLDFYMLMAQPRLSFFVPSNKINSVRYIIHFQ